MAQFIPLIVAGVGAGTAAYSAEQQRKAQKRASQPQQYSETTERRLPPWLEPYVRDLPGLANTLMEGQLQSPRLPPTFEQAMSGNYMPGLPSSPVGGIQPGQFSQRVEDAWRRNQESLDERLGDDTRPLTDKELQRIRERVLSRHPDDPSSPFLATPPPGGGLSRGGGGGRGFGGGGGGGGFGGFGGGGINQIGQLLLGRAQQPPPPALGAGMDFLSSLLGRGPDLSALNQGLEQQQQTFADITNPRAPINQFIARGMGPGFSSAAPMQRDLAQQLMAGMSTPASALPSDRFQSFFDMAGQGGGFNLFDPLAAGDPWGNPNPHQL